MTTPDRTEELVRAMLERRAGGTVPDWLLGGTMQQVVQRRQSRRQASGPFGGPDGARLALIAAVALSLLAIASVLAAGAFLRRDDDPLDPPALVLNESPAPPEAVDLHLSSSLRSPNPTTWSRPQVERSPRPKSSRRRSNRSSSRRHRCCPRTRSRA